MRSDPYSIENNLAMFIKASIRRDQRVFGDYDDVTFFVFPSQLCSFSGNAACSPKSAITGFTQPQTYTGCQSDALRCAARWIVPRSFPLQPHRICGIAGFRAKFSISALRDFVGKFEITDWASSGSDATSFCLFSFLSALFFVFSSALGGAVEPSPASWGGIRKSDVTGDARS